MDSQDVTPFAPIRFLAVMATGGFASAPFLVKAATPNLPLAAGLIASAFSAFFVLAHLALGAIFAAQAVGWTAKGGARRFMDDLSKAPQVVMPLASLAMTINVFMGPLRALLPALDGYAGVWQPIIALVWALDALAIMLVTAMLVLRALTEIPADKPLGFVWLFPVLALGLSAAAGAFVAQAAAGPVVAHVTGFGAVVVALAAIALIALVGPRVIGTLSKGPAGVPRGAYYSFFNLVPTAALFGIAFAHWAGYAKNWLGLDLSRAVGVVVAAAWVFGLVYALATVKSLFSFVRSDLGEMRYYGNQWALTCVPIAWSVLTTLLYETLWASPVWPVIAAVVFLVTVPMAFVLGERLLACAGLLRHGTEDLVCG